MLIEPRGPDFGDSDAVTGYVGFAIFAVIAGTTPFILNTYVPEIPANWDFYISFGLGAAMTALYAYATKKKQIRDSAKSSIEYAESMEKEKQKKIDEMQRAASKIPEVTGKTVDQVQRKNSRVPKVTK